MAASALHGVTFVDLYAKYPRFDINVDDEQRLLLEHEALVFQFPLFWYSTPSLLKEWQDLVLEYGFAYGGGGDKLAGKLFVAACSAGGPPESYATGGFNQLELRDLLAPLEATINLCQMRFLPPFALFSSLRAEKEGRLAAWVASYRSLLEALRDERLDEDSCRLSGLLSPDNLPIKG